MLQTIIQALVAIETWIGRAIMAIARLVKWAGLALARLIGRIADVPARAHLPLAASAAAIVLATIAWQTRDPIVNWYEANAGLRPLLAAKSWHYHLDKVSTDAIQRQNADLVVMDYALNGGRDPLPKEEVEKLKTRADGSRRKIVSYMSIGESETYRFYWDKAWETADAAKRPAWLGSPNCAWPGAWSVKFWEKGWRDIVYAGPKSYLKRIIDAGFDGVYLDRVDIYEHVKDKAGAPDDLERAMVDFVKELADAGRRMKPGFLVIPQNADGLLAHRDYRRKIDALGKEDLLYGQHGTGERNPGKDIDWSQNLLDRLLADHKPVFAVEYLVTKEQIALTTLELRERGLVPTFQDRSLDGSDPTMPRFESKLTEGTPEWIKTMCSKENSW